MGSIPLNFGKVKGFEPLPDGIYNLVVTKIETKKGKDEPHNPYLNFTYSVIDPEHEGRKIFDIAVLTQDSLWKLQAILEAITGHPWKDDDMELDPKDIVGLTCKGVVYSEEYNGKMNNKIKSVLPADSDGPAAPTARRSL